MAFTLELFTSSIANGATSFQQVTFSPKNIFASLQNGCLINRNLPNLMAVMGVSANMAWVQPQWVRQRPFPFLTLGPNNRGTAIESPPRIFDFSMNPIPLPPNEEFDIFATQNSAGAQTVYVACLFSDGVKMAAPSGKVINAHWSATTTLTAGAFTSVTPIFDQPLPGGLYSLIGARVFSATALFFNLLPQNEPLWRPGGAAVQAYDQLDPLNQRAPTYQSFPGQGWGEWVRFYQNTVPAINIFATGADTAEEGVFDLVQISGATI